jgi:methylglutaconyl-CoA hydratase
MCAKAPETAWEAALILSRQILTSGMCPPPPFPITRSSDKEAPLALKTAKEAIEGSSTTSLEEGLDLERRVYDTLLDSFDRQEGLKAFAEKRKPRFEGR